MPAKNTLKHYKNNSYYHIYNRGIEKRIIYQDKQDYAVFLNYLKEYLSPLSKTDPKREILIKNTTYQIKDYRCRNHHQNITLIAYCLMPNHFHLLVKQKQARDIELFMKSLGTRYTMYFNKRYQRQGGLFQDRYKAVLIDSDEQLLHLSRYIHLNPTPNLFQQPSSYPDYLQLKNTSWVHPQDVLQYFKNPLAYKQFVEAENQSSLSIITNFTLDS